MRVADYECAAAAEQPITFVHNPFVGSLAL
jgi:hypothetical protein